MWKLNTCKWRTCLTAQQHGLLEVRHVGNMLQYQDHLGLEGYMETGTMKLRSECSPKHRQDLSFNLHTQGARLTTDWSPCGGTALRVSLSPVLGTRITSTSTTGSYNLIDSRAALQLSCITRIWKSLIHLSRQSFQHQQLRGKGMDLIWTHFERHKCRRCPKRRIVYLEDSVRGKLQKWGGKRGGQRVALSQMH